MAGTALLVLLAPGTAASAAAQADAPWTAEQQEIADVAMRTAAANKIRPIEIQVVGSWAFAWNMVSGTVTLDPTGEIVQVDSKQLVVYRRGTSGTWGMTRMITNSNGS